MILTPLHPFDGLFSRTTWLRRYQKGKTSLHLNEARDDGVMRWQWHQLDHTQTICTSLQTDNHTNIGADFRFEVPGQSSVELMRRKGSVVGGTVESAKHEPIMGVQGRSPWPGGQRAKPPEAESILVIGCPTEPANLAPLVEFSK